ncbi:hypothetical protein CANCADRAFT_30407 [Tortispora caseinolytica NRRL Y-17796]|uniref:Anaphase-promoting complex subunit 4-like WD40 domain-containing protein n=1 Tax=Tortispora caseinolytica NRRL Y-17796 TaxID=767744 RepID=A0A1E4TK79_9ASCO|nr:hypothetical protein CANCADRAFT_30407 [Tortispora caseinolytica NRRL Y-17796]
MSTQYLVSVAHRDCHESDIFSICCSQYGVFTTSGDGSIKFWTYRHPADINTNPADGATVAGKGSKLESNDSKLGYHHLGISPNQQFLGAASFTGALQLFAISAPADDTKPPKLSSILSPDDSPMKECIENYVWAFQLAEYDLGHDSGSLPILAVITVDHQLTVFDLEEGSQIASWSVKSKDSRKGYPICLDVSPSLGLVAVGDDDGTVHVYSLHTGRSLLSLTGISRKAIRSIKFSPDGTQIAVAGDAGSISIYDVKDAAGEQVALLNGHGSDTWVFSLDWSSSGDYLLSGGYDGNIKIWDARTTECIATHSEADHSSAIFSLQWTPIGPRRSYQGFVAAGSDMTLRIYRLAGQ